jgi:hypothetical protein
MYNARTGHALELVYLFEEKALACGDETRVVYFERCFCKDFVFFPNRTICTRCAI